MSIFHMPPSPEAIAKFGRFKANATDGPSSSLTRVSLFVDLCTSMICSACIAA